MDIETMPHAMYFTDDLDTVTKISRLNTEESRRVSLGTDTKCQNNHNICALHLKFNGENVIENKNNHLEVVLYYIYNFKIIMDKSA